MPVALDDLIISINRVLPRSPQGQRPHGQTWKDPTGQGGTHCQENNDWPPGSVALGAVLRVLIVSRGHLRSFFYV